MTNISKIEIHLEDWTAHYPSGIILYDFEGNMVDSDYADTVDEFKEVIDRYKDEIKENNPQVIAIIDMGDADISNVWEIAREISKYIDTIKHS